MMSDETQDPREALAQAYADFAALPCGAIVLADLDQQFGGNPFAADNPHLTSHRCGHLAVISYILTQIANATEPQRQETANG